MIEYRQYLILAALMHHPRNNSEVIRQLRRNKVDALSRNSVGRIVHQQLKPEGYVVDQNSIRHTITDEGRDAAREFLRNIISITESGI